MEDIDTSAAKLTDIDPQEIIKIVSKRKEELANVSKELKKHFVGIDQQIDTIISNITTWYVMPSLISRPVTVCLFGPTGVGKTDLVRRLVKLLNFQDKYCEIEMNNQSSSWAKTVGAIIRQNGNIESGKPAIILLDEIQSFRTLEDDGSEIHEYDMKDIWALLSDGKLPFKAEVDALLSMMWDYNKKELISKHKRSSGKYGSIKFSMKGAGKVINLPHLNISDTTVYKDNGIIDSRPTVARKAILAKSVADNYKKKINRKLLEKDEDEDEDELENKYCYYTLSYYKKVLRLDDTIEEIATWSDEKKKQILLQRMMDKSIYEEEDYTKSLIFISGNIDDAYGFTKNAKEVDIDADILYEISKKITILDIKEALGKRFRPEQISRMGNTHVIYPTLSKKSFELIIQSKINSIIGSVKEKTGIDIVIDESINKLIYDNGVFPTQGTRPVFSTISEILETSLPDFILECLMQNKQSINIKYENNNIMATILDKAILDKSILNKGVERSFVGSLDKIKEIRRKNYNCKALSAVHEAAHAVVHTILFNMSPSQIVATPLSSDMEGFVYSQKICLSKEMIMNRLCVLLAGKEAEKIIFGEYGQTSGGYSDLKKATALAAQMVREYAMSNMNSYIDHSTRSPDANNNVLETDAMIEYIILNATKKTEDILNKNMDLLLDVVEPLTKFDKLLPEDFKVICEKHNVPCSIAQSTEDVIYSEYSTKLDTYKKNRNKA